MEEEIITFETAKLAVKKFKDVWLNNCALKFMNYNQDGILDGPLKSSITGYYPACTQSFMQKWLREIHKIEITISNSIMYNSTCLKQYYGYSGEIELIKNNRYSSISVDTDTDGFTTYEEALEKTLQRALKLI